VFISNTIFEGERSLNPPINHHHVDIRSSSLTPPPPLLTTAIHPQSHETTWIRSPPLYWGMWAQPTTPQKRGFSLSAPPLSKRMWAGSCSLDGGNWGDGRRNRGICRTHSIISVHNLISRVFLEINHNFVSIGGELDMPQLVVVCILLTYAFSIEHVLNGCDRSAASCRGNQASWKRERNSIPLPILFSKIMESAE